MTDNLAKPVASGTTFATHDVGGVHHPLHKMAFGASGTATPVSVADPMPVDVGTVAVTGSFYPATQPVSGTVAVTGAYQATQPVSIASMPSTPVTGTFWQATQPISGTVGVSGSVAVTGSFYQATQPVSIAATVAVSGPLTDTQLRATAVPISGTVTANVGTGTQPVSGTFWQATQPVSIASMPSTPVTGTFWQATQPVSGPLTDAQLRATPVPVSGTFTPAATPESTATFRGRVTTFRTPGRAGTTGQKLFALHNATGSTKIVHVNVITVDIYQTVVKAVTVAPPVIRIHRFTAIPTNGTALTKVSKDTSLSANASITAWGDASADGTLSATTLTVTIPANSCVSQEFAPRLITAVGYEMFDRTEMVVGYDIVLRPLEGLAVNLDYTLATQNPATDMWIVGCDWWEV